MDYHLFCTTDTYQLFWFNCENALDKCLFEWKGLIDFSK